MFTHFTCSGDEFDGIRCDLARATQKLLLGLASANYRRIGFVGWCGDVDGAHAEIVAARFRTSKPSMSAHGILTLPFAAPARIPNKAEIG